MAYSSNQAFLFGCVAKDGGGDGGLPHEVEMGDQVVQGELSELASLSLRFLDYRLSFVFVM